MLKKIIALSVLLCSGPSLHADQLLSKEDCANVLKYMAALSQEIKKEANEQATQNNVTNDSLLELKKVSLRKAAIEYMRGGCLSLTVIKQ